MKKTVTRCIKYGPAIMGETTRIDIHETSCSCCRVAKYYDYSGKLLRCVRMSKERASEIILHRTIEKVRTIEL